MNSVGSVKVQFWQTKKSGLIMLLAAVVCVGVYFGGNLKAESLRQIGLLWWFLAGILALVCRRYYRKGTKIGVICAVALSAVVGLLLTKNFVGIKFVEWAIYAAMIGSMSVLSFLPAFEFLEYESLSKSAVLYSLFSIISFFIAIIAALLLSALITFLLIVING